jgi:hypothetical protein
VDSTVIQIKPVNLVIAEERTLITLFERLRIDYSAAISATFAASALDPPSELDLVRLVSLTLGYEDIETRRERLVRAQLAIKGISQNVGPADSDTPHYATGGEQMHAIGRAIQDSLGDGILDDILEVDPGMSVRFLDAFFRARHAVPIDYLALCAAKRAMVAKQEQSRLSGQAISDKKERRVYDDLLKGLIRAGYNPDIEERATLFFHTYSLSDYPQIPETLAKRVLFNILNGGFTVEQALTRANLGFRPEIILPDEHDLSILERLGLGQLARHYPKANRHLVRIFTPENLRKLTKGMLPQI